MAQETSWAESGKVAKWEEEESRRGHQYCISSEITEKNKIKAYSNKTHIKVRRRDLSLIVIVEQQQP